MSRLRKVSSDPKPARPNTRRQKRNTHIEKHTYKQGVSANPKGRPPGKTLLTRIKELLREKSLDPDRRPNTRFDDCADAFLRAMESGSFIHAKEFIDREEGKVPTRISDADGGKIKMYVGMPVDDDRNAP